MAVAGEDNTPNHPREGRPQLPRNNTNELLDDA